MRFNPPPGWSVPHPGWAPPQGWTPPPHWPPAPEGWQFWIPTTAEGGTAPPRRSKATQKTLWVAIGAGVIALTAVLIAVIAVTNGGSDKSPSNFNMWTPFGGVDAGIADGGRSVMLNTHDTTASWSTKWSGLAYRGQTTCSVDISGHIRDVSHNVATPGGFGIGLAAIEGSGNDEELRGVAIQFDYGFQGYRTVRYPDDSTVSVAPAQLDSNDHTVRVRIDGLGNYTMDVDGVTKVSTHGVRTCGNPAIRIWAGATTFRDFSVKFTSD